MLTSSEAHLIEHPRAHGHEWIRAPNEREVDPLLAIIIIMGIIGFPTVR